MPKILSLTVAEESNNKKKVIFQNFEENYWLTFEDIIENELKVFSARSGYNHLIDTGASISRPGCWISVTSIY